MERKYEKYYNVNLKEIEGFFGGPATFAFLEKNNINNLGKLFEFFESSNFTQQLISPYHNSDCKGGIYKELSGSVKLLRYKYLGEDINIDLNSSTIMDFGFTHKLIRPLTLFCIENKYSMPVCLKNYYIANKWDSFLKYFQNECDFSEFFVKFTDDVILSRFSHQRGVGKKMIEEIKFKSQIIVDWYKEKYINKEESNLEDFTANDLKVLLDELERLMEQNKVLNEKIAMVQGKIKQCMEVSNETRRQK